MAAATSADHDPIVLDNELEGDQEGTTDFVFRRAGDPLHLLSPASPFDLQFPPSRPLAVSDHLAAVFLAHPSGFMVARTKDLIEAAMESKEKEKGGARCVRECSVANVSIDGGVSVLALSSDSLMLAACSVSEIQFFSADSLLNKEQKPLSSCTLGGSGVVKDFKWLNNAVTSFAVLSKTGSLYHGHLREDLKDVMDNVDAVDCCAKGNYIAIARKNTLSILSSGFKEQCRMSLLFQSWSGDADSEGTIKVDSLGWVRDDSIIIGCVRLNEDGDEEGYLVQAIRSGGNTFFERSCKPVVFSFPNLFEGIVDDILPAGVGPHLLLSYLDRWELMVVSNKKNIDQHILLLKWSSIDEKKEIVSLEILEDKYIPRIDLQENGDDNVILGFGVENVSLFEKINVQVGPEMKELSPQHVLLCLTGEGKLILYYIARISDPSDLPRPNLSFNENSGTKHLSTAIAPENDLTATITRTMDNNRSKELSMESSNAHAGEELKTQGDKCPSLDGKNKAPSGLSKEITGNSLFISCNEKPLNSKQVNVDSPHVPPSGLTSKDNVEPGIPSLSSTSKNVGATLVAGSKASSEPANSWPVSSSSSSFMSSHLGKGVTEPVFGGPQTSSKKEDRIFGSKSSTLSSGGSLSNKVGQTAEIGFGSQLSPQRSYATDVKSFSSSGARSSEPSSLGNRIGNVEAHPTSRASLPSSQENVGKSHFNRLQSPVDYSRGFRTGVMFDSEQDLSKNFYNVNSMTKELDALLSFIEKDGGFRDVCIAFQQSSLSAFEDGVQNLSELLQIFESKLEEQVSNIEDLRNKMFQVSARQAYMKGIVSQSSDSQYWDIWNRQKLSPEFELKRQNILKANQNLTNQLVELERHFNALEMNRFGETGRVTSARKAVYASTTRSRQTQLHSVYNAVNSQLAAAEQLSECLSKQISTLNISSPSMKRGVVTKELFESIGLIHESGASHFLDDTSKSTRRIPSSMKECTKSLSGALKSSEPEMARRRRVSLDRSLTKLEPQKTTVKRIAQQQRFKISSDQSFRANKKIFDSQMAAIFEQKSSSSPASSIVESYVSRLKPESEGLHEKSSKPSTGSQQSSVFKWVRGSPGPSQGLELKYHELSGQTRSATQPSKLLAATPSPFSSTHVQENVTSSSTTCIGTTHTDHKTNSLTSRTTATNSKPISTVQPEAARSMTSSKVFENSSAAKTVQGEARGQSTLTLKNREDDLAVSSSGSTKQLAVSSQNFSGVFKDVNISPLSSAPSTRPGELHGKTTPQSPLTGSTGNAQHPAKTVSLVATQPPAATTASFAHASSSSSALHSSVSTSATTSLPFTQASAPSASSVLSLPPILPPQKSMSTSSPSVSKGAVSSSPRSHPAAATESSAGSKSEVTASQATRSEAPVLSSPESRPLSLPISTSSVPFAPNSASQMMPTTAQPVATSSTGKDKGSDSLLSDEDDMEEEAPDTGNVLNLGALGGFGFGSAPPSNQQKPNPFGGSFNTSSASSPFTLTTSPGELFRPASLSIPSAQQVQSSQSANLSTFSSNFSSGLSGFGQPAQIGSGQGFGQPAQIGAGQQALGSVLGSFGQSRQLGTNVQGMGFAPAGRFGGGFSSVSSGGGFGGFAGAAPTGAFAAASSSGAGFAGAATSGGFAAAASAGGGFASAAGGGGFAVLASRSGGFSGAASAGGGFGGAGQGGGFGSGGFGAFGGSQASGFSAFGGNSAAGPGRPPSELLTQMRK